MRLLLLSFLLVAAPSRQQTDRPTGFLPAAQVYDESISGEVIRETPHFQIYAEHSYFPVDLDWLQTELETIYAYLVERMGVQRTERFALTFRPPDTAHACPLRGQAWFDGEPVAHAVVFADERTSRAQLSGVLAHEIAHLLHARGLRAGTTDIQLTEGFASWAAGKYWHAWQGTSADNVRTLLRDGQYTSLEKYYREIMPELNSAACLQGRDRRYNSFGAFIDFLITDYGMDKFLQLLGPREEPPAEALPSTFALPPNTAILNDPKSPIRIDRAPHNEFRVILSAPLPTGIGLAPVSDFKGVYGLSLSELEEVWLKKLNGNDTR